MLTELPLKAITPELKVIIENYPKCIHWYELITKFEIPLDIIKKYNAPDQFSGNEEFFWKRYTMYQTIKDVRNFINVIGPYMLPCVWAYIFQYQVLDEDFIDKSLENLKIDPDIEKYWGYVSQHQKLSIKFIEDHYDKVNWGYLACEPFPEDFIVKYLTGDNVHESRAFAGYRDVTALYFHNKELFKTIAPLLTKEQLMKILIKKVE